MSDLISREEAYRRITELSQDLLSDGCINLGNASEYLRIIRELPSADRPTDGDLIGRADAIEALGEEPPVWCDEEYEIAERNQWRADIEAIKSVPSADRPRGEWISKEELIDAIKDAEFVYDGDEDGHKEHDISKLVRAIFKDIIDNLPSADMRGDAK